MEIVLVEENPSDIAQTLNTLKKASLFNHVHVLKNVAEALDFLFRGGKHADLPPLPAETLILLSLNLPGAHGLDLLRKLKSDQRTKGLPVIILTSSQEERGVMQSYKLGASGCIVKPVDLPKFIEVVAGLRLGWLLIARDDSGPNGAT